MLHLKFAWALTTRQQFWDHHDCQSKCCSGMLASSIPIEPCFVSLCSRPASQAAQCSQQVPQSLGESQVIIMMIVQVFPGAP